MDARILRTVTFVAALYPASLWAANYRTQNFLVTAPSEAFAKHVGDEAERFRKELSVEWLGYELPAWSQPCPIQVEVGATLGAGGATSFSFDRGQVYGWQMSIQGPADRVVDAVLPHEVTHTIFATHFRRPLPRWADEGACTTVEHASEKAKQDKMLIEFLHTDRGIAFSRMFAMKEYPRDVMPLYSQGYSLAKFLIQQGGRKKFMSYLGDGMETENWIGVTKQHYGFEDLRQLQDTWLEWVRQGSPQLPAEATPANATVLAASEASAPAEEPRVDAEVRPASAAVPASASTASRGAPQPREPAPYSRGPILRAQNAEPTPEETERLVAIQWPSKTAARGPDVERGEPVEYLSAPAPRTAAAVTPATTTPPAADEVDSTGWRPSGPARAAPIADARLADTRFAEAPRTPAAEAPAAEETAEILLEWSRPAISTARATTGGYSPGSTAVRPASATVAIPKWPNRPTVVDAPAEGTYRR